jgi:drug/metabolite transporter superfamily protein YnfA
MKAINQLKNRFSIMGELLAFLWLRRLWWMIPMVIVLLAFGLLIIFAHSSALAPFLYPLF